MCLTGPAMIFAAPPIPAGAGSSFSPDGLLF